MKWRNEKLRMNIVKTTFAMAVLLPTLFSSCRLRPLEEDGVLEMARIRIYINWSNSGINVPSSEERDRVHRVSIRFFPKDGSPVFDRYLEEPNVIYNWINVPVGKYSVVVFNESIYDEEYWNGAVAFTGVDSYADFAAHAVAWDPAERAVEFPFYTPSPGESVIIGPEPRKLSSWSLDHFEVTSNMALMSRGRQPSKPLMVWEEEMLEALVNIQMRRLTRLINVTARVTNLVSAWTNYCALSGFANTVRMASGETMQTPSINLFKLNGRQYDSDRLSGTTRYSFLSFGRVPQSEAYTLTVDALYVTGELYTFDRPFDVTSQVVSSTDPNININVSYDLEYREGGIAVDDWGNDYEYDIQ